MHRRRKNTPYLFHLWYLARATQGILSNRLFALLLKCHKSQ